jgi:hypothetical protein
MPTVQLQKPVVEFVLFICPVSLLYFFTLFLAEIMFKVGVFLLDLVLVLLLGETYMAFLAEK